MRKSTERKPIPQNLLGKLSDSSISDTERVRLAEKCREDYGWVLEDMLELTCISSHRYNYIRRLLAAGRTDLLQKVDCGVISLCAAVRAIKWPEAIMYPFLDDLKSHDAEILLQNQRFCLYRQGDKLVLGVAYFQKRNIDRLHCTYDKKQHLYLFDNFPFVVRILQDFIGQASLGKCYIKTNMDVNAPGGARRGNIRHYILAEYAGIPIEECLKYSIVEGNRVLVEGMHDYRIENMRCREIEELLPGTFQKSSVYVNGKEIYLIYRSSVTILDNTKAMQNIVKSYPYHPESRGDGRMVLVLGKPHNYYFYQLVMAAHLYGHLPKDRNGIIQMMRWYKEETKGLQTDHLNGVAHDCRLQNLMLMTPEQNQRKEALQRRMRKYEKSHFANAVRHDGTHIRFGAGTYDETGKPLMVINEIYTVEEFITVFSGFVEKVERSNKK